MAKSNKPRQLPQEVDFTPLLESRRGKLEEQILHAAIDQILPERGGVFEADMFTASYENVTNYSCGIVTYRYAGEIILRRFKADMEGLKWRYESPLFGDKFEN